MSRTLEQDSRLQEKLKRELGPVVLGELQNPKTEDVLLNPDGLLWAKRAGEGFVELGPYNQQNAISAMGTIAAWHETVINYERPIVECELPVDGFAWMANRWVEVPTPRGLQQMRLRRGHLNYRIRNAGLPWTGEAAAADCIVTVVPLFPDELSPEQETAIDRLVASNSGTAGTPAGDRMAAWNRVVGGWRDRRR